jgi:hypothetical protein
MESDAVLYQITWPPQSPDPKSFEMVWDALDYRVKEKQPTSAEHMLELIQDSWKCIPANYIMKLVERIPTVCKTVIKAKGGYLEEYKI